ncbi:sulfotransferase [Altererythrobacter sp. CC-YST694]|nr:sulfotransferase [Altererythrobacter sp. CC-YST694]
MRAEGRVPQALAILARLERHHPRFSRLYEERGHCYILLGDGPAVIEALQIAVSLNPTLPACWDMLEQLYRLLGDAPSAEMAAQNLAMLKQLPPELVVANSLYSDGDADLAEDVLRAYLQRDSGNVGALRLLARICADRDAPAEAEALLKSATERAPDYHEARFDYAMVLLQQQKHLQARQQAEWLLRHVPGNRDYLKQYAAACVGLGDHEAVIDLYARLLADGPASGPEAADLHLWRANALKVAGRQNEAIAAYHASLAAYPDYGVAWFSLSNLKTYRFTDTEIARMQAAEARADIQDMDRVYLCFALGKALEDRGEFASSWRHYERGNAMKRAHGPYRPNTADTVSQRLKEIFTPQFFAARTGWGVDDPAPIFILGLPRSGSTLIEQILASHSQVEGTQELTDIGRYAGDLCGRDTESGLPLAPEALTRLDAGQVRALGERFLAETRAYRRLGRPFFIDKMPNNFWHIGLIQLILPRATIINVRRDPMSCCFSNLKQLFGTTNQPFAYGMADIAHYYGSYLGLMRHWDSVLPGRVLRVHYEDVVNDLEGSLRRLLGHCGLPFEPACLTFHDTVRSVRTPSSEQVRRPLAREGLTQWRNYEPWLAPLRRMLGDALTSYRN